MTYRYFRPASLQEALNALKETPGAIPFAGGTDIVSRMQRGLVDPAAFILLEDIGELREITVDRDRVFLGAGVIVDDVLRNTVFKGYNALLKACSRLASPQIRNQGTIGGNLMQENRCMYYNQSAAWRDGLARCFKLGGDRCYQYRNSPNCVALLQSDLAPVLIAYGAQVVLVSAEYRRTLPLEDLYLKTAAKSTVRGEILAGVSFPAHGPGSRCAYVRETLRGSFDFPVISCAVKVTANKEGLIREARLVLGSCSPRPEIVPEAAGMLAKMTLSQAASAPEELIDSVKPYIKPFRDSRYSTARIPLGRAVAGKALRSLDNLSGSY